MLAFKSWKKTNALFLIAVTLASYMATASGSEDGPGIQAQGSRCPAGVKLTNAVTGAAAGLSEARLIVLKTSRALTNQDVCLMPQRALERAIWRAENPKPDHPGEWAKFRAQQQADETGTIKPNGLIEARRKRKEIVQRTSQQIQSMANPSMAGIAQNQWIELGPGNIGGRMRTILVHPTTTDKMWVGSVAGGIWASTNGGVSWNPVDDFLGNLSVSSLVMSPTNSNVIYAGTGEGFFNADAVRGAGIFKSADGGITWEQLASTNPAANSHWYYVNRLAIHPTNGNILLAATNDGLYRSADGGQTWALSHTGRVADVRFSPALHQKNRAIIGLGMGGGPVAYSLDAGQSWNNSNLDTSSFGITGRAEIASASDGVIYASTDTNSGEIWRSTDGANWHLRSAPQHLGSQGWYDNALWVDPVNSNHLIIGGIDLFRSLNGGLTWTKISSWFNAGSVHADHHAIVSSPTYNGSTNKTIFFGNDGGVYKAQDIDAVTSDITGWTNLNNGLGITQFYSGAGHSATNGLIIGGTQDNGSLKYSGTEKMWSQVFGGDGGASMVDPADGNYIYGEYVNLQLHRSTNGGATPSSYIYQGISDAGSRANFIAPFILDPNNSNTMIAGGESVWRSTNIKSATVAWTRILGPTAGGGYSNYASQLASATGNSDIILVGKNDGALWKTVNATASSPNWAQVGMSILPHRMILSILIDKDNHNRIYVGYGGYSDGNIYRSTDGGSTWTNIGSGLPSTPIRTIQQYPGNPNYLYIGTEVGIFASQDGGNTWNATNDGPANVSVDQLFWLNGSTLVAATHGRGMFKTKVASPIGNFVLSVKKLGLGTGIVESRPSGINCGITCSATFSSGAKVVLIAIPDAESAFNGWSGACTGDGICTVSMTAARNVHATFKKKKHIFRFW